MALSRRRVGERTCWERCVLERRSTVGGIDLSHYTEATAMVWITRWDLHPTLRATRVIQRPARAGETVRKRRNQVTVQ